MEILVAQYAGFCFGVERAVKIAREALGKKSPIYCLGKIVHNSSVVKKLQEQGMITVNALSEIPDHAKGVLILSAHGVSPETIASAREKGLTILDTTCPKVKNVQDLAQKLSADGYQVIIVGDKEHREVQGVLGWAGSKGIIVDNLAEAEKISQLEKLGIIAQTTQAREHFDQICTILMKKAKEVKVCDTICSATAQRQASAVDLAKKVEVLLVIGDRGSANTKRLFELSHQLNPATYLIQDAAELDLNWLKSKNKVGVTAGASTPDWIVEEILRKIKEQK